MNTFIKVVITCLILACTSCAYHIGTTSGNFSEKEYIITGIGLGSAKTTKFIGIGGLNKEALVFEAKRDLYNNIHLEDGDKVSNITVDFQTSYYVLVQEITATVHAEIIHIKDSSHTKNNYKIVDYKGFSEGDEIFKYHKGRYLMSTLNKIKANYCLVDDKKTSYNNIFNSKGEFIHRDQKFIVGTTRVHEKLLIGFNQKYILVIDKKGKKSPLPINHDLTKD